VLLAAVACLHAEAPALLAQEAAALKHLHSSSSTQPKLPLSVFATPNAVFCCKQQTTVCMCMTLCRARCIMQAVTPESPALHAPAAAAHLCHGPGDDAPVVRVAKHGVCLAAACLPVGKDAHLRPRNNNKQDGDCRQLGLRCQTAASRGLQTDLKTRVPADALCGCLARQAGCTGSCLCVALHQRLGRRRMPQAGQHTGPSTQSSGQHTFSHACLQTSCLHTLCPSRALWMSSLISSNTPAWSAVGPNTLSNVKECFAGAWPVRLPGTVMSRARPSSSPATTPTPQQHAPQGGQR
jgi:hypothetical protein